jgi:hypothetical protein
MRPKKSNVPRRGRPHLLTRPAASFCNDVCVQKGATHEMGNRQIDVNRPWRRWCVVWSPDSNGTCWHPWESVARCALFVVSRFDPRVIGHVAAGHLQAAAVAARRAIAVVRSLEWRRFFLPTKKKQVAAAAGAVAVARASAHRVDTTVRVGSRAVGPTWTRLCRAQPPTSLWATCRFALTTAICATCLPRTVSAEERETGRRGADFFGQGR